MSGGGSNGVGAAIDRQGCGRCRPLPNASRRPNYQRSRSKDVVVVLVEMRVILGLVGRPAGSDEEVGAHALTTGKECGSLFLTFGARARFLSVLLEMKPRCQRMQEQGAQVARIIKDGIEGGGRRLRWGARK